MDQLSVSESAPSGLFGQTPGGHGDEAPDGLRGNRRLARGAELRRSPPRPPRHSRCHPPPRRRRFSPLRCLLHPPEAQEGTYTEIPDRIKLPICLVF